MRSARPGRARLAVALVLALALACRRSRSPDLRVSMIPTTDPGKVLRESRPLVDRLEQRCGTRVALTVPTSYAAVVEAIANDQVDIAYLGGFTYVQASRRAGVVPLVQRDRDQRFHSLFITQPDSGIRSLDGLKGKRFAFGDVNSTSGHLMPEYVMRSANVDPEVLATAIFTGGHDATALAVANRRVDAGAIDEAVYERMVKEKKLDGGAVRVFYTTPPFVDYVWAARRGLDPGVAACFAVSFLALDPSRPGDAGILEALSATRYVKADDASYDPLRQAARDAGLLP